MKILLIDDLQRLPNIKVSQPLCWKALKARVYKFLPDFHLDPWRTSKMLSEVGINGVEVGERSVRGLGTRLFPMDDTFYPRLPPPLFQCIFSLGTVPYPAHLSRSHGICCGLLPPFSVVLPPPISYFARLKCRSLSGIKGGHMKPRPFIMGEGSI